MGAGVLFISGSLALICEEWEMGGYQYGYSNLAQSIYVGQSEVEYFIY